MGLPWMQGEMPSVDEIRQEFTERNQKVQAAIEEERAANKGQKDQKTGALLAARRSGGEGEEEKDEAVLLKPSKDMEQYDKAFDQPMNIFSTYHPDVIEADLLAMLEGYKI
tara:strand:+ start:100 stop:432 length:333 start_codon:yes stop_codon:yes gene_type:complete